MLEDIKSIYIVGIKGVAMAGLAVIFKKMGKEVSGSDTEESFITDELLQKCSIKVLHGFDKKNVPNNADFIIYSAAHQGIDNPEVKEGLMRSIPVFSQGQAIGELMKNFKKNVAVCGCHGKSTTSSLLTYALIKLNIKPSYLIGSPKFNNYFGADFQNKDYFIVEADEYGVNPPLDKTPKFHLLDPDYIIVTNIDFDHPDVYTDINETKKAFLTFFNKLYPSYAGLPSDRLSKQLRGVHTRANSFASGIINKKSGQKLFYCIDDENLKDIIKKLPPEVSLSYGFSPSSDLQIKNIRTNTNESIFNLSFKGNDWGDFETSIFGDKNVSNAAAVILFLYKMGFTLDKIKEAIKGFSGAKRRFEKIYQHEDTFLFDDYAHHPAEILALLDAVRKRFPKKRVIAIFEPHTFSRTSAFKKEFALSLAKADFSFIMPIFTSARENADKQLLNSSLIENEAINLGIKTVKSVISKEELLNNLKKTIRQGDVILTVGAGSVYKLKDDIIKLL